MFNKYRLPRIAVTMGDPAGVGPELCLKVLKSDLVNAACIPVVFGSASVLDRCAAVLDTAIPRNVLTYDAFVSARGDIDRPTIVDFANIDVEKLHPGITNECTGEASFQYFQRAIDSALANQVDAITTGPINKEAIHAAGHHFPGHTEMLAERCDATNSCMMQYSEEITCTFVTTHVGYAEVPGLLSIERIHDVLRLTRQALLRIRNREPHILVCGLNPHAGENGLFGSREEQRFIMPAIQRARNEGISVEGPLPPDTAFIPTRRANSDAVVCMYHDQGHIPLKTLVFDHAVNTTLGLPIIRTSVDHGTACDIAWTGKTHFGSMQAAIQLASKLAGQVAWAN